jgi:hypothetical protein
MWSVVGSTGIPAGCTLGIHIHPVKPTVVWSRNRMYHNELQQLYIFPRPLLRLL